MADRLYIDFESYSACDIKKRGGLAYARHPSTNMLCMGYAFDDEPAELLKGIYALPGRIKDHVGEGKPIYAHNAGFDYRIWNIVCTAQLDWPVLSLNQMVDTAALCLSFQVPPSLADAGAALNISLPKSPDGKRLIKICCTPGKNGEQPMPTGPMSAYFERLFAYCKRDVEAMRQVVKALPREYLIPQEQYLWELTYEMNTLGLPVDHEAIKAIHSHLATYIATETANIPKLCNNFFQTPGQVAKIKEWCGLQGYPMEAMTAEKVGLALEDPKCPDHVRRVLEMRQELGRSSVAKFTKLLDFALKGKDGLHYVHDNMQYHGAGTGRWSGRSFQMHNLPRASVPNPDELIMQFVNGEYVHDPVKTAKALIRPMVRANVNELLVVSDYSSIENRVLHWLAGDFDTLEDFKNGIDQYKTMASARYQVAYDMVTKEQRQMGKVIILGCGYGMGGDTFQETAKVQFGMDVSLVEAKAAVSAYRAKYSLVKELWNKLKLAMVKAVLTGQKQTVGLIQISTARVKGTLWLAMKLPSGKCIYYMDPQVRHMFIPDYESMGKVPTVTHMGTNPYTKKWSRLKLIPGRITENAVQGTARECLAQGKVNITKNMPHTRLIGSVHDEALARMKKVYINEGTLDEFNYNLCNIPWAQGLPLAAEGWIGERYRK